MWNWSWKLWITFCVFKPKNWVVWALFWPSFLHYWALFWPSFLPELCEMWSWRLWITFCVTWPKKWGIWVLFWPNFPKFCCKALSTYNLTLRWSLNFSKVSLDVKCEVENFELLFVSPGPRSGEFGPYLSPVSLDCPNASKTLKQAKLNPQMVFKLG